LLQTHKLCFIGFDYINGIASHILFLFISLCERYFHLEIMASFSSHGFTSMWGGLSFFSSSDNEMLEQLFVNMDRQRQCAFARVFVVANSFQMFNANELNKGACQWVDPSVGVQDVFIIMWAMPRLFKMLTNFTLVEFDKLTN
jgi:hypothetical protein